jgi:tripartite ATP-independent transporter DctM subunit
MDTVVMILSLIIFIILGVPVCFSLGLSGLFYLMMNPGFLGMLPQRLWAGANSSLMIALPLFILAGELMNRGGITQRILNFSMYLVRPIKGGLGEVNVIASMIFGGISGSSVADTSAIGSIIIPQMIKQGFTSKFTAGITVASSTIGMIIPPSIPMIIYSSISGASIGALFLAGLIPGAFIGITQLVLVNIISRINHFPRAEGSFVMKDFLVDSRDGFLALLMPLFIVLSITAGICTATESAAIAVLYAFILGLVIYRELDRKNIWDSLKRTLLTSSSIMIIIAYSLIFTWVLAFEKIPDQIGAFVLNLNLDKVWVLLFLDVCIILVGMFIDTGPALLLISPILLPLMGQYGVGPLQLGAIMLVGLAMGLATPPIGMCLYVASKISKLPVTKIFKGAVPYLICNVIILLLVTFIPEISTWIPSLFFK